MTYEARPEEGVSPRQRGRSVALQVTLALVPSVIVSGWLGAGLPGFVLTETTTLADAIDRGVGLWASISKGALRFTKVASGGDIRIAGVEVDLAGAAGRQNHMAGPEGPNPLAADIKNVGSEHPLRAQAQLLGCDQVDRVVVLVEVDVRMGTGMLFQ